MKDLVTHGIFEDFLKDEKVMRKTGKTSCLQYSVNNIKTSTKAIKILLMPARRESTNDSGRAQ
jgi:hypothetical protein